MRVHDGRASTRAALFHLFLPLRTPATKITEMHAFIPSMHKICYSFYLAVSKK